MPRVVVRGVPPWVPVERLLGPQRWAEVDGARVAELDRDDAADLQARLRGVGLGGAPIEVEVHPPPKRTAVREARLRDARRRRETTPGFTRPGARTDEEGRWSLTPEALALAMGRRVAGRSVVDATCGVGGNTIGFARAGCDVVAIEPDATRLVMARHNAALYGVADRIRFVAGRAEDHLPGLSADLLFVDPPWGPEWDRARTTAADLPLWGLLEPLRGPFRETWLKAPPSFDPSDTPGATPEAWFGEAAGDRQRVKFVLLRFGQRRLPGSAAGSSAC